MIRTVWMQSKAIQREASRAMVGRESGKSIRTIQCEDGWQIKRRGSKRWLGTLTHQNGVCISYFCVHFNTKEKNMILIQGWKKKVSLDVEREFSNLCVFLSNHPLTVFLWLDYGSYHIIFLPPKCDVDWWGGLRGEKCKFWLGWWL